MKRIIFFISLLSFTACQKIGTEPTLASEPTLIEFKTLDSGFSTSSIKTKTDPKNGNVWISMYRMEGAVLVPYVQCFGSNLNSISGKWVRLTDKAGLSFTGRKDFDILSNGNALFIYGDMREGKECELAYYAIVTPDGRLLKPEGTLIYDTSDHASVRIFEADVVSDKNGGAWIALAHGGIIVVRHILPSGEMSNPVTITAKEMHESYHGLELMLAEDGGAFLSVLDMTVHDGSAATDLTGHTSLLKISSDSRLVFEKQTSPDEACYVSGAASLSPDTNGGAYMVRRIYNDIEQSVDIRYSHFDKDGNIDAAFAEDFKSCAMSYNNKGSAWTVVPGDNTLCVIQCDAILNNERERAITSYSSMLTSADMNGNILVEKMLFKEFGKTTNPRCFVITPRENKILDIFYLSHDNFATPTATVGSVNVSSWSINPSITSVESNLGDVISLADNDNRYANGKMTLSFGDGGNSIKATQIIKL